jgi:hypothetical protein
VHYNDQKNDQSYPHLCLPSCALYKGLVGFLWRWFQNPIGYDLGQRKGVGISCGKVKAVLPKKYVTS